MRIKELIRKLERELKSRGNLKIKEWYSGDFLESPYVTQLKDDEEYCLYLHRVAPTK